MIHYTLLPDKDIKLFRREYRIRILVVSLFFLTSAIVFGIISLIPAYILSYSQEKDSVKSLSSIKEGREARGINVIVNELNADSANIDKIKADQNNSNLSQVIEKIVRHRTVGIKIISFQISPIGTPITSYQAVIQGKSYNRQYLLDFKKTLADDTDISSIELPISDLAKSKDLTFAMRFIIKN